MSDVASYGMSVINLLRNSGWSRDFDDDEVEFIVASFHRGIKVEDVAADLDKVQRYVENELRLMQFHEWIDNQLARDAA